MTQVPRNKLSKVGSFMQGNFLGFSFPLDYHYLSMISSLYAVNSIRLPSPSLFRLVNASDNQELESGFPSCRNTTKTAEYLGH